MNATRRKIVFSATFALAVPLFLVEGCKNRTLNESHPNIVGGWQVKPDTQEPVTYFSTVALTTPRFAAQKRSFCSGTLIGPRTVLTAAHCLVGEDGKPVTDEPVSVVFGTEVSSSSPMRKVIKAVAHEKYDHAATVTMEPSRVPNDIGLVFIAEEAPAPFVPARIAPASPRLEQKVWIAGYGVTLASTEQSSSVLRAVAVNVNSVSPDMGRFRTETFLKGSCSGDSGGPVYTKNENGEWFVNGVVSAGAQFVLLGNPICTGSNVFTDVGRYGEWISQHGLPEAPSITSAAFGCVGNGCVVVKGERFDANTGMEFSRTCSDAPLASLAGIDLVRGTDGSLKASLPAAVNLEVRRNNSLAVRVFDGVYNTKSECVVIQPPREQSCADFGPATGPLACLIFFREDMHGACERLRLVKRIMAREDLSSDATYDGQAWRLAQTFPNGGGVPDPQWGVPPAFHNAGVGSTWRSANRAYLDSLTACEPAVVPTVEPTVAPQ